MRVAVLAFVVCALGSTSAAAPKAASESQRCLHALDVLGVDYDRARRKGIAIGVRVRGRLGGVTYWAYKKRALILDCSLVVSLAKAGRFQKGESVVAFITGNGLKTIEAVAHEARPFNIKATVSSFEKAVGEEVVRADPEVGTKITSP